MALYAELGPAGFGVWDAWSSGGQKYQAGAMDGHWRSFERGGVKTVTGAKIYRLATDHGWKPPRHLRSVQGGKAADTPPKRSAKEKEAGAEAAKQKKFRTRDFLSQVDALRERYTLIYGTDTVYDHTEHDIIRVANLRLAMGKDPVNWWLYGEGRRMVTRDRVVFDPSGKHDLPEYVNLFYGMPMKPDPEKPHGNILELLLYLCGDEAEVYEWVLKWIAYPLQHPGAKMETAIVMHGEEGAGKNLFWEVVRSLYGPYASVITQNELESQFNTWATRKLFMIANEVVSRSELREHKGRLKNYITERELQINEKLLPLRTEENHMNFVFLSNETQPLALDRTDRRYLVLWTPPAKPREFYQAVDAERLQGGAAGLYDYLMRLDLGDFNEHAKPVVTEAKRNLIQISKSPPELFYDDWRAGLLQVPFHSAKAADLYRAFIRWCAANGEKHAPSQTKFGGAMGRLGVKRSIKWLRPLGGAEHQATVYEVGVPEDSEHFGEKLEKLVSNFAQELEQWTRGD
jgi:putative DNA primase/helicase